MANSEVMTMPCIAVVDKVHEPVRDMKSNMNDVAAGIQCRRALTIALGTDKVAGPDTTAYAASLSSYYSVQQKEVRPACIVLAQSAADVSAAVKVLATVASGRCPFAIRSGGRHHTLGMSNVAGGVTIDLSALNRIELEEGETNVRVGPGATWDAVYARLDPLGLSVNGGRHGGVGVGGLTLGGGLSFFSPRYGWTCDTVSNFQIVLADGRVVDANATSHPDLFSALRGGSNNFGIVTRVDLDTFSQGPVWTDVVLTAAQNYQPVLDEFVKFVSANSGLGDDEYASVVASFTCTAGSTASNTVELYYTDVPSRDFKPAVFSGFRAMPGGCCTLPKLQSMTTLAQNPSGPGSNGYPGAYRTAQRVATVVATADMISAAHARWNSSVSLIMDVTDLSWTLTLEPLPPSLYGRGAASKNKSSNALGLSDRRDSKGPLVMVCLSASYPNAVDDEMVAGAMAKVMDGVESDARGLGVLDPFVYLPFAGRGQDPIASYGAESVARLKEVRDRYDPTGVFTRQVMGGFKLPA